MIKLAFLTMSKKLIRITISNRVIRYYDDINPSGFQLMPKDQNLVERLLRSGKPNLKQQGLNIIKTNSGDSLKDYEKCETDEEVAEFIRNDMKINPQGVMEIQ